jgi:hypothetical protein
MDTFSMIGQPMYIPSYEEYSLYRLAHEALSARHLETLMESSEDFFEVIDDVFVRQYERMNILLWKLAHQDDFLDTAIELRELLRSHAVYVAERQAKHELTKPV